MLLKSFCFLEIQMHIPVFAIVPVHLWSFCSWTESPYDAIADEIFRLRDQKEQSELDSHHREEAMNRIKELQDFIAGQETDITEFDEALVRKLIAKITVFTEHFTVEFKSGITIDIEA